MAKTNTSPRVVLLVEDEWLLRATIAEELERAGWRVLEASTGEGAIGQLRNGERIDLLVTDIRLAGYVSGWEVAEAARSVRAGIPVIYTSGNAVDPSRKVEGSVFLSKPCLAQEVVKIGCELIQSTGRAGTQSSP
jgi:CheY-like chemotaxis protein